MAGIFGFFDYNKPGPGIPKDAPPKAPIIVFFGILQRKFWNFIKINLMVVLFNLPALAAGLFVAMGFFPYIIPGAESNSDLVFADLIIKFVLVILFTCVPMVTVGPVQAGFTYIMRNYAREEHAFIWWDFKDTAIKNLKQSIIVSLINFFVTFLLLLSFRAYLEIGPAGFITVAGVGIIVSMLLIFACMNMYIYPMMITFDLTLKDLYKNAFIFAIIKFIPNIGIFLLCAFIIFFSFGLIVPFSPIVGLFIYLFFMVSFIGFIINFYVYPALKKYMISRLGDDDEKGDDME